MRGVSIASCSLSSAAADDQRAAVQLQLKSDLIKVAPGGAESIAFTVKNLGTQVEEFRCW